MKRILSLGLAVMLTLVLFAGCEKKKDRILYSDFNLSKNVTLAEYKGVKVDTASKEFKEFYNGVIDNDVEDNNLYVKKTEGTVANGDTANIDYVGKKDGVAFEGGTANGYDLTIGSNSFIDGFESGLIGKKIGDTVDLNLTFPEKYQSEELAGKDVVFTVKINYVTTTEQKKPEDYFKELDFESLKEYENNVKDRAVDNYLLNTLIENSKIKKYSEKDKEFLTDKYLELVESNLKSQYGMNLDSYLSTMEQTKEEFTESIITEQIEPTMDAQMPIYALIDKEGITVTSKEIEAKINEKVKSYNNSSITADDVKEYYGEYYFEDVIVKEKALEFMRKNAKIS